MKINLRKASVVQQTITDEIKRLGTEETTAKVSLFETNVHAQLEEQLAKVRANHAQAGRLLNANKFLRGVVAKKNAEAGITDYLAEEAMLASAEARLKAYSESAVRPNLDALAAEIESRKANSNNERVSIYGLQLGCQCCTSRSHCRSQERTGSNSQTSTQDQGRNGQYQRPHRY